MFSTYFFVFISHLFRVYWVFFVLLQVFFIVIFAIISSFYCDFVAAFDRFFMYNYANLCIIMQFYAIAAPDLSIIYTFLDVFLGCFLYFFRVFLIISSVILRMLYISTIPKSNGYQTHLRAALGSPHRLVLFRYVSSFWLPQL